MGTTILTIFLGCLVCAQAQFPNPRPGPGGGGGWPGNNPGQQWPNNPQNPGNQFPGGNPQWPNNPGVRPGNPGFPQGGPGMNPGFPGGPGTGPGTAPMTGCLPGWTNFGNFCYKYFFNRLPYDEANRVCMRFRAAPVPGMPAPPPGHLIVTKDMMHNKFQHNWLRYTGGGNNKIWMGLAELPADPESNRYFWADGTEFFWTQNFIFNRFKPDQPQQNAHRQAVHSFNNRPDNTWVTTSVETEVSFICQYQYKF